MSVIPIRQDVSTTTSLKEKCIHCGEELLLKDLRAHAGSCYAQNYDSDASSTDLPSTFESNAMDEEVQVSSESPRDNLSSNNSSNIVEERPVCVEERPVEERNEENTSEEIIEQSATEQNRSAFNITYEIVDRSERTPQVGQVLNFDIDQKISEIINQCLDKKLSHPVEIIKCLQSQLV